MKRYFELLKNYNLITLATAGLREIHRKFWKEMIVGSYAQNYEDLIINKLLGKENGTYLEIGGYHPIRLSNTYYFYKKGWQGTTVEPNPEVKKIFKKIRPKDIFINAGVSEKEGLMNYYKFLIPAINTFSKKEADKSIGEGHKLKEVVKIKLVKINDILKNDIDFLSLDTEGFDEIILKTWPWKVCRPKIICVESDVKNLLLMRGYQQVMTTKHNLIFSLKD